MIIYNVTFLVINAVFLHKIIKPLHWDQIPKIIKMFIA